MPSPHMPSPLCWLFCHVALIYPKVRVLLASLIGSNKEYGGSKHAQFNALLPGLAASHAARGNAVEFVDMEAESGIGTMCDGTFRMQLSHPLRSC